ncbi:hypothetical protein [Cellulosilyticum ruminicola]|uniref:hypothetical protein n=1 Tax=Cellulosilyticum ruminicola TaxID=425254 RepID=UPI0006D05E6F|nr:hypothetical protein [Cellulosilyticum ruminicola]
MNYKIIKNILFGATVTGLIGSNIYFMNESKKPMYNIGIGMPVTEECTNLEPSVKSKEDAHLIEMALIKAHSIEQPEISKHLSDATMWLNDWKLGVCYSVVDV